MIWCNLSYNSCAELWEYNSAVKRTELKSGKKAMLGNKNAIYAGVIYCKISIAL